MQVSVFVSYCHNDVKPDEGRLKVLVDQLKSSGNSAFEMLVDYQHPMASVGALLSEFIEKIDSADAILIILTPQYKQRVDEKIQTGVYSEFRRIYDRYLLTRANNSYGRTFLLLPVIFSGTFDSSCPKELKEVISVDASWLHIVPDAEPPRLRQPLRARLATFCRDIASRISGIAATKNRQYQERQEQLFRHFLFDDTKSRWDRPENIAYLESAFVKTGTFLKSRDREIGFIVGRKGSGKSTITHVLPLLSEPTPGAVIRLEFDNLPFDACFNVLLEKPAEASDLRHVMGPLFSYELIWDVFLHLSFAAAVRNKLSERHHLRKTLRDLIDRPLASSKNPTERSAITTKALFVYAFEKVMAYIDRIVREPRAEAGIGGVVANFHPTAVHGQIFGDSGSKRLETILADWEKAGDRILVTADGFDTMIDYFAHGSGHEDQARQFEREILLSLFQLVLNGGPAKISGGPLYNVTDYCIAIPHDRFSETRGWDHDSYQYRNKVAPIEWTGIELSTLVRKRLALLRAVNDPKGPVLEERLNSVMAKAYPELPNIIDFQFGAAKYRIPLFLYVLRHTLWRPRDVLYFYASILAASEEFRKKKSECESGFVRQVIAGATIGIVQEELIAEYSGSFRNLGQVLQQFRQSPEVLSWAELKERLDPLKFETDLGTREQPSLEWKVELLYELAILGVILDKTRSERFSSFRHAFIFNERRLLTQKLGRDNYPSCQFTLHPVLCEYLNLDTSRNPELILPLDWEYLHKNEVLRKLGRL